MSELTIHKGSRLNDLIKVEPLDDPDCGGATWNFQVYLKQHGSWEKLTQLRFQNQPLIDENGKDRQPNGLSNECLIAIMIDRLQAWQFDKAKDRAGKFSCRENALVITKLEEAMHWLQHRSRDRRERGVEGKAER